jgi:hypothetical protein
MIAGVLSPQLNGANKAARAQMRLDARAINTVVYVGTAPKGGFEPVGTAVLVASHIDGQPFQTLVTARHVIEQIAGDEIYIRVNVKGGGVEVQIGHKSSWRYHPDKNVDLAICGTVLPPSKFDILHLELGSSIMMTPEAIERDKVGPGDVVSVVGLYLPHRGENKNLPIVRTGHIAAMPGELIRTQYGEHHAYLIEVLSIGGLSGSPVFAQLPFVRDVGGAMLTANQHVYFMGILLGHHATSNPTDILDVSDDPLVYKRMPLNTGIGVVAPWSYFAEMINDPELVALRRSAPR